MWLLVQGRAHPPFGQCQLELLELLGERLPHPHSCTCEQKGHGLLQIMVYFLACTGRLSPSTDRRPLTLENLSASGVFFSCHARCYHPERLRTTGKYRFLMLPFACKVVAYFLPSSDIGAVQ